MRPKKATYRQMAFVYRVLEPNTIFQWKLCFREAKHMVLIYRLSLEQYNGIFNFMLTKVTPLKKSIFE